MDFFKEFNRLMVSTDNMALATSVDNIPNVRIINFYYDSKKGIVYFSTVKFNPKVNEFSKNNKVAFTTVPAEGNEHIRVNDGIVKKSNFSIFDLKDDLIGKYPDYGTIIEEAGEIIDIYEIHFKEANVTLGFKNSGKIIL